MTDKEALKIHINPDNRRVSINDPKYQEAWARTFEQTRADYEQQLQDQVERGELQIPIDPSDQRANTPESALHVLAHVQAEAAMQDWAVKRGIGLVGVNGGLDHGQEVEYIDDPEVPFLDFAIEQAA